MYTNMCCYFSNCQICCRKSWTLILAIFENLCFAGCIYGWPSLQFALANMGYFDTCSSDENHTDQSVENEVKTCEYQDSSFSLIFTMATFAVSLSTLPNGIIYDKAGTRVSKICASILFLGAFLLFIFSTPEMPYLLYPAMVLWAMGGCMLLVTNFQVANLFAAKRSTVITLLSACFDSSAAMLVAIRFIHEAGVSLQTLFIVYICLSLLFNVNTFLLLPKSHIPHPLPDDYFYKTSSKLMEEIGLRPIDSPKGGMPNGSANRLHGYYEAYHEDYEVAHESVDSGLAVNTYHATQDSHHVNNNKVIPSLRECVLSGLFVSHLVWMSILQHRNWFFLSTFQPWLTVMAANDEDMSMSAEDKENHYTTVFGFIQLGAIFCGPLCGLIVDRNKKSTSESGWKRVSWEVSTVQGPYADLYDTVLALLITSTLSVLFSIAIVVPMLQVQYVSFVLQVILRSFLYGLNAAFIAIAFPVEHLGTLLGVDLGLAAVFGLIQFPLFKLCQSLFVGGDPFWVNVGLLALNFVTYAHPVYVAYYCKRETLRMRTEESERRRRTREAEELKIVNIISTV